MSLISWKFQNIDRIYIYSEICIKLKIQNIDKHSINILKFSVQYRYHNEYVFVYSYCDICIEQKMRNVNQTTFAKKQKGREVFIKYYKINN